MPDDFEQVVNLCKRRGFVFPSAEIYGGFRSTYDYGPVGVLLLRNVKDAWWRSMVQLRDDVVGLDAAILSPPAIWQASGHLSNFTDPLVDCRSCRERFRLVAEGSAKRLFTGGTDLNPRTEAEIPDHGCWENLIAALEGRGIADVDIPSPFNIFQTMEIDPRTGAMLDTTIRPAEPTNVDFQVEMDCLVAVSACPESGRGQAIRVEILERSKC
ncbi:MAG: DUF1989 domain-containing protein [Actinobacteria bacterium]|nr:DUF1989 domain-containing protein [Actinomycetota bacterium]